MLRKRAYRIILLLIAAEVILLGILVIWQRPFGLGFPASSGPVQTPASGSLAAQAQPSPLGTPTQPQAPGTLPPTTVPVKSFITLVAVTPTLPPINVVTPTATPQVKQNVAPIVNPAKILAAAMPNATRVVIPSINVDTQILEMGYTFEEVNGETVTNWQIPDNAVGHMIGSANPGALGNVVLSGHNNIQGAVFRKLYTMQAGDEITLFNTKGVGFKYRVSQSFIVQERGADLAQRLNNAQVLLPSTDARLTLISCWPETDNSNRAIVIAELVGGAQ